jgi:hypothetical protein
MGKVDDQAYFGYRFGTERRWQKRLALRRNDRKDGLSAVSAPLREGFWGK